MANEYLKRTPTSQGNRKKWTWAGWLKINKHFGSGQYNTVWSVAGGTSGNNSDRFHLYHYSDGRWVTTGTSSFSAVFTGPGGATAHSRDPGAWMHVCLSVDTTGPYLDKDKYQRFWINGIEYNYDDAGNIADSADLAINGLYEHYIGARDSSPSRVYDGQMFDLYLVDGQALTPDVFGFHKDGNGYVSAGSTHATDFKPGQWMPHAPRKIKSDIERRGGFGTNGFYLPMNDSSNPGADFHCTPNTIIKLKGEDLPQPRNGAPTTSDAYVSQVRKEIGGLGFAGCVKLDGNQGLSIADTAALDLGTGDFTIEGFYYFKPSSSGYPALFDGRGSGSDGVVPALFRDQNSDKLYYFVNSAVRIDNMPMRHNEWMHVAICRSSGTTRAFVDGALVGSFSDTFNYICNDLFIGQSASNTNDLFGFVSNFRIVKGSALYTADFTRPTAPLENVTNTILLCANSSTSATASTITPSTISTIGSPFATTSELTGSIVYAVPGIAVNMVTNGTFDTNTTGWTASNAVISSVDGTLKVDDSANAGGWSSAYQTITTIAGHSYRLEVDVLGGNDARYIGIKQGSYTANSGTGPDSSSNYSSDQHAILDFTATGTSVTIMLTINNNGVGYFDNVVLYDFDAVDYSAHVRGSGSNKTVTSATYNSRTPTILRGDSAYGSFIDIDSPSNTGGYVDVADSTAFDNINLTTAEWTTEAWFKRGAIGGSGMVLFQFGNATDYQNIGLSIHSSGTIWYVWSYDGSSWGVLDSTGGPVIPQDEWCHIAVVKEATPTPRIVTYVNGTAAKSVNVTANISYTSPDYIRIGGHYKGPNTGGDGYYYNGSIFDARFYSIAKYRGGFDISKPYTPVGIEDFRVVPDTCSNNFATFNPLVGAGIASGDNAPVLKDGNLYYDNANQSWTSSTLGVSSGKYYAEFMVINGNFSSNIGVVGEIRNRVNNQQYHSARGISYIRLSALGGIDKEYNDTSVTEYTDYAPYSYTTGHIIGVTIDYDNREVKYYKNGTLIKTDNTLGSYTPLDSTYYFLAFRTNDGASTPGANWSDVIANFGQNPSFSGQVTAGAITDGNGKGLFKYAPPSGFLALCEDNLSTPAVADPGKHFKTVLYSGRGSNGSDGSQSIKKVGFKPDLIWVKKRSTAGDNKLIDVVRGSGQVLESNTTDAEGNESINFTGFNSDGFDLGSNNAGAWNESGHQYVAWCWKAGGPSVTNNDGSITTQVSANRTAGFSIVKGTMTSGTDTLGHGLSEAPEIIFTKQTNGTTGWYTYAKRIGSDRSLRLDQDSGSATFAHWVTHPTSSVFSMGSGFGSSEEYVAYCFHSVKGFSKTGVYVGNGSADGPFVYCGFKPAWVLLKNADQNGTYWTIFDSSRKSTNPADKTLNPNLSHVEETSGGNGVIDLVSNGFKCRNTDGGINGSAINYVFLAFAESPFQTANAK